MYDTLHFIPLSVVYVVDKGGRKVVFPGKGSGGTSSSSS